MVQAGLLPLLAGIVVTQAWAGGARPYLPAVGPAPLRFEELPSELMARFDLPPLKLGWTTNAVAAATPLESALTPSAPKAMESGPPVDLGQDPFASLSSTASLPTIEPSPKPPVAPTPQAPPEPPPEPQLVQPLTAETEAISPRVIVKYFSRGNQGNATTGLFGGTNSVNGVGYVAPIGFQPPAPGRSSSANYSVSPPASK